MLNVRDISQRISHTLRSRATSSAKMEGLLIIFGWLSSFPKTPTAVCIVLYYNEILVNPSHYKTKRSTIQIK